MAKKAATKKISQGEAVEALRANQRRLLDHPGVTSVGVGYRFKNGKKTDDICIVCTVEEKLAPEALQKAGRPALPEGVKAPDGKTVPVDVIQRSFRPSHRLHTEATETLQREEDVRRSRQDPMRPGISVSHIDGTAGTIGAFVYDGTSGEPLLLSNWHVLNGPTGNPGDPIVQPGPYDNPDAAQNYCGALLRSHLGYAGDCAVASIDGRDWNPSILGLDRTPVRMADPDLDDLVVKSGRTTGITRGIVSRVDVVVRINYGGGVGDQEVGGFEIRPRGSDGLTAGEISMGGDSGSVWMLENEDDALLSDVILGLHFAGETDPDPEQEHAVACKITSVAEKLGITFSPPPELVISERQAFQELYDRLASLEEAVRSGRSSAVCDCGKSDSSTGSVASEAGIPVYGRWCGPGHGSGEPIDAVDGACRTHDKCYERRGYFDCGCDQDLVRSLDRLITSPRISGRARTAAIGIRGYFTASPCIRHVSVGGTNVPIPSIPVPRLPNVGGSVGRAVGGIRRRLGL